MKYNLTQIETKGVSDGTIITIACYTAANAALAELICDHNNIKYKVEQSESPTGKNIFIFFFYPDTYYKAFRAGDMLNCPELYQDQVTERISDWRTKFQNLKSQMA